MTDQGYSITFQPATSGGESAPTARIVLRGEFDMASSDDLRAAVLGTVYARLGDRVIVDLAEVTFVDSTTIRMLREGFDAATAENVRYRVINSVGVVHRVLEVMGLIDVFDPEGRLDVRLPPAKRVLIGPA